MTLTIRSKPLAIALAASVALNLFLIGFVTERALRGGHGGRGERGHHGVFGAREQPDAAARQAMRQVFDRDRDALRAQRKALHAARAEVSAAFAAEPFDRATLERALAELRAQTVESQRLLHESLLEVAPSLSPEQRARLARRAIGRRFLKRGH